MVGFVKVAVAAGDGRGGRVESTIIPLVWLDEAGSVARDEPTTLVADPCVVDAFGEILCRSNGNH